MGVMVAVMTFDGTCKSGVVSAVSNLDFGADEHVCVNLDGYDCDEGRNILARKALEGGFDHILYVDSDTVPPKTAYSDLKSHGKPVMMGFYARKRHYDGTTCLYKPDFKTQYDADELREMRERGEFLVPSAGGGFGCALVETRVFKSLPFPWFNFVKRPNGSILSEDLYFCKIASDAGFPVFGDSRVGCRHIWDHIQEVM